MEILVDSKGRRVFGPGQPYVNMSEDLYNFPLYNPNGIGAESRTGLYDAPMAACTTWVDHFHQNQLQYPARPSFTATAQGDIIYARRYFDRRPSNAPSGCNRR